MTTLADIETKAEAYAAARAALADRVAVLQAEIDALTRRELPAIREAMAQAQAAHADLRFAVESAPELFIRPRTRVLHGLRVGWMTGKGRVEIDDEADTIARIRRLLPEEQAELLIRVRESVDRNAVADLTAADLKRLRIRVVPGSEQVVIKPQDSALEKLIKGLLPEIQRIEQEDAA